MVDRGVPANFDLSFATVERQAALLALIALILFNAAVTPHFVSLRTFNVNMTQVTPIVIVAVGMTLVIATAGIDLSVGSLMAVAGQLAPIIFLGKIVMVPYPVAIVLAFIVPVVIPACTAVIASSQSSRPLCCSSPGEASRRS